MNKITTDENLRTFELGMAVAYATGVSHQSPWHSRDSRPKLISELGRVDGIKCVYLDRNSVDITKAESCNWEDLLPDIERIISVHGNGKTSRFDGLKKFKDTAPVYVF